MTPHLDAGRGTFVLDRRIGKLGRLKIASGTTDREEFAALNAMVTRLRKDRRWDLLSLMQPKEGRRPLVSALDMYDAIYRGQLGMLPTADELRPLAPSVERWLAEADLSPRTKADYRQRMASYPTGTTVQGLPELLAEARSAAIQSGQRQTFNNRLMATSSFLRATFGPASKLLTALPLELDVEHREGNPQEPEQIRALALRFLYPDELWALCLTAMRRGEYFPRRWEMLSDRINIQGEKGRHGRTKPRYVPLVYRIATPRIAASTFYKALSQATDGTVNVHDLRKTAQRWWEDAGVADWRISLYAGHARGRKELTRVYRKPRDMARLLIEDGERMRAWLGDPPQVGLRAVSA